VEGVSLRNRIYGAFERLNTIWHRSKLDPAQSVADPCKRRLDRCPFRVEDKGLQSLESVEIPLLKSRRCDDDSVSFFVQGTKG